MVAAPVIAGSVAAAHGPTCPQHVGSAWTRNGTCVPCIGEWTQPRNHQEVPKLSFMGLRSSVAKLVHSGGSKG